MSKINSNDFLTKLSEKYKDFLELSNKKNTNSIPEKAALEFREKALNILVDISDILEKRGKEYSGSKGEEKAQKLISRFIQQNQKSRKNFDILVGEKNAKIPTMDDLLDSISTHIGKILLDGGLEIGDIYKKSAKDGENGIIPGDGKSFEKIKTAPKFEILMKVLNKLEISPENISITKEKICEDRMRKFPYYIIHIFNKNQDFTITVSDEVGQACYIYPGNVSLYSLEQAKKGDNLEGFTPKKVTYSNKYEENLLSTLQDIINENNPKKTNNKVQEKTPEIIRYQAQLLEIIPELKKIGLEEYNGIFYFHNLQGMNKWPKIGGKNLTNFPNASFNKENNIGSEKGVLQNPTNLQQLFDILEIPFANKEQEKLLFKNQILEIIPELKKVGLEEYNGTFYFHNLQKFIKWPKIGGKNLTNFPNATFNKENNIGNKNGVLQNPTHLKQLFDLLGIPVANKEQEKLLFKNQILKIIPELKKIGLEEYNGIFYFHNLQGIDNWPKIGEKNLNIFPSTTFNKKNDIGNENGVLQNPTYLKQLFDILEVPFANKEQEILLFKNQILEIIPELRKIGLEEHNGIFYFHNLKGNNKWPKIGGRNLKNFPSTTFNKQNNIGNERGVLLNSTHLKQLFKLLGIPFANKEQEILLFKNQILEIIPELRKIGLEEHNGIFYFHNLKGNNKWPKIGGRNLKNFPSRTFNKENNIGSEKGVLQNPTNLQQLFDILEIPFANKEQEKLLFKNQILEIIPELKKVGLEEHDGVFYFHNLQSFVKWPKIGGKSLQSFPNATFNKENNIGNERGALQSSTHLQKLFKILGLPVYEK